MLNSPLILFIDANLAEREYYTQHLGVSSPNFNIVHAATGKSGLAFCDRHLVDCVVLEIDLPDISGFEVLMKLVPRIREPKTAVIMLTRLSNTYLLEAAMRNGAQAALCKRVTAGDTLERAILKAVTTMSSEDLTLTATAARYLDKPIRLS
jgi:CheY-like chemotaxis protein